MPRRNDIAKILVIGSGPIVIGESAEFDYSGTQACKALKSEGYEVVLVNSNPATIMTDPELADRTYVEPLTVEFVAAVIERQRPDAVLATLGGEAASRPRAEPLPVEFVAAVIERERPDATLPTVGGQTALNLAVDLAAAGVLEKYNVQLIGASIEAIKIAED